MTTLESPPPCASDPVVAQNYQRNFFTLVADPAFYVFGVAFFDPVTVLPVLMVRLGATEAQIGLLVAVLSFGWTLTALIGAHAIHGKGEHRRYLLASNLVTRAPLFLIPIVLWLWGTERPGLALWMTAVALAVFGFGRGLAITSWYDMIAKTIPVDRRGRFFGVQATAVGIALLIGSSLVLTLLRADWLDFPGNYAVLTLTGALGVAISMAILFLLREPKGVAQSEEEAVPLTKFVGMIPGMLREHPGLSRMLILRMLFEGGAMAVPFYAIYSGKSLGLPEATIGIYAIVRSLGRVFSGPIWGAANDRFGSWSTFRAVGVFATLPPLVAVLSGFQPALLIGTFAIIGVTEGGLHSSYNSLMLEAVHERYRALAVGVANIGLLPVATFGYLGGVLVGATSYNVLFTVAASICALGFVLALRPVPRQPRREV